MATKMSEVHVVTPTMSVQNPDKTGGSNVSVSSAHTPNGSSTGAPNSANASVHVANKLFHMSNPA